MSEVETLDSLLQKKTVECITRKIEWIKQKWLNKYLTKNNEEKNYEILKLKEKNENLETVVSEYKDLYKTEHGIVITLQETQTRIQETQTRLQETQTRLQQTQTTLVTTLDNILATVDSLKEDRVTVNILQWTSKPESNR